MKWPRKSWPRKPRKSLHIFRRLLPLPWDWAVLRKVPPLRSSVKVSALLEQNKKSRTTKNNTKAKRHNRGTCFFSSRPRKMQKSDGFYRFFETRIILTGIFTEKNARIAFPLGFYSETPRENTRATDSGSEHALTGTEEKIYRTHTPPLSREYIGPIQTSCLGNN